MTDQSTRDLTDAEKERCMVIRAIENLSVSIGTHHAIKRIAEQAMREGISIGRAEAAHSTPAVPDGWQLVPKEPTPEMLGAAYQFFEACRDADGYRAMLAASPQPDRTESVAVQAVAWRCFHCDETFTDVEAARDHFGATEISDPACRINIKHFRQLESVMGRWIDQGGTDAEYAADNATRAIESKHRVALQREEEKGYARGLADGRTLDREAHQGNEPVGYAVSLEANMNGFLDVCMDREGEFTIPLYTRASEAARDALERAARIAEFYPTIDITGRNGIAAANRALIPPSTSAPTSGETQPAPSSRERFDTYYATDEGRHECQVGNARAIWQAAEAQSVAIQRETPLQLAIRFHETYERLAPSFGYETRPDTKQFDPESKNGRLMVAVCAAIANAQQGAEK